MIVILVCLLLATCVFAYIQSIKVHNLKIEHKKEIKKIGYSGLASLPEYQEISIDTEYDKYSNIKELIELLNCKNITFLGNSKNRDISGGMYIYSYFESCTINGGVYINCNLTNVTITNKDVVTLDYPITEIPKIHIYASLLILERHFDYKPDKS